jgi:hypothetical protein
MEGSDPVKLLRELASMGPPREHGGMIEELPTNPHPS